MNTLLAWRGSDPPAFLQKDNNEDIDMWTRRVQETIAAAYPQISPLSLSSLTPLRSQRPSEVRIVRCNQYHYQGEAGGSALLLGDAAHCTGGTLGQGANSALQDVVMLDQVLDEVGKDLRALPSLFTQRAHPEGEALYSLLQLPPRGWGRLRYELAQAWRRARGQQSTQQLLSQSLTPFSQISRQNNYWIDMATKQKTAASSLPIKSSGSV
eukprot:gene31746-38372_t